MTDIRDADLFQIVDSPHKRVASWEHIKEQLADESYPVRFFDATVSALELTADTATTGILVLSDLPNGAIVFAAARVLVPVGFVGDDTATFQLGTETDPDRFSAGTPSIFDAAPTGIQSGVPSGEKYVVEATPVRVTVTSATDIAMVIANGTGLLTIRLPYIATE